MFSSNDKKSLITVIIPIYNGELFLSECIESVRRQSYPHWELLLIDDGSSDRSADICKQHASSDSRIIFLRLPHGGVSAARNAGLVQGRGDYFFFLDCDDIIHPQTLEAELHFMQMFGCAFAGLTFTNVGAEFKLPAQPAPIAHEYHCFSCTELRNLFGNHGSYELWAIGGKLLARSAVEGLFFPETVASAEDTLFLLEVIARNENPAVILTDICYFRRLHQNNAFYRQTFELKIHYIEACLRLRARHFELYGTPGYWEQLCVYNVFNWYVAAQESSAPDRHAAELRQELLNLLHDNYAHFLPGKRRCTAELYLFSPPLYRLLKRFYWRLHKLMTGKGEPCRKTDIVESCLPK